MAIREICMVKPATGRKVDCYFTTGHVRRFDMAPLLGPDCGPVFQPLRDRKTFLATMTVMNGTLAFDVAGERNERKCVDIDAETIFDDGMPVGGTMRTMRRAGSVKRAVRRKTAKRGLSMA